MNVIYKHREGAKDLATPIPVAAFEVFLVSFRRRHNGKGVGIRQTVSNGSIR